MKCLQNHWDLFFISMKIKRFLYRVDIIYKFSFFPWLFPDLQWFSLTNLSAVLQKIKLITLILWQNLKIKCVMSIFFKTFAKQFHFPWLTVFHEFPWLFHPNFPLWLFPEFTDFQVSGHPAIEYFIEIHMIKFTFLINLILKLPKECVL